MIPPYPPRVYLVGAGPGDPGLLTRRAEAVLARAEVVLYDSLTHPAILDLAPAAARRIYVGKPAGEKKISQEAINALLVEHARAGAVVVRLKGGDGYVFGRGGEEAIALAEAGVPFEVVPGISSAIAVPSLAGIPVTHRSLASALHVVTGHEDPDSPDCSVPWEPLARIGGTIVILMAGPRLPAILRALARGGLAPETPFAVISQGSVAAQRSLRGSLGEAAAHPARFALRSPSVAIVGAVAGLPEAINWFESRPLFGRRIALTRPGESGSEMLDALREAGAEADNFPSISLRAIKPASPLASVTGRLREASGWLILPSPAAARFFFAALEAEELDARALHGIRVAAVGARSVSDLAELGIKADFVPSAPTGESLAAELPISRGQFILIAGSSRSRPELADGLRARGSAVEHLSLYENAPNTEGLDEIARRVLAGELDSIVAFSPSAAEAVARRLGIAAGGAPPASFAWYAIGPTTAAALRALGISPLAVAERPEPEALVRALAEAPAEARRAGAGQ